MQKKGVIMKILQSFILVSALLTGVAGADEEGNGSDICYSDPYAEGMMCSGSGGVNCKNIIPIVNSSGEDITDINVYLSSDGIMNGSLNDSCGVDDNEGNCTNYSENNVAGKITIAGYSYGYILDDMANNDQRDTYIKSTVSVNFNNNDLYTTYTKNGTTYYSEVHPCGWSGSSDYETGPFDAWDTDSNIKDRVIQTKVVSSSFDLNITSMDASNSATVIKEGIDMHYRLYDLNSSVAITGWELYDASADKDGAWAIKSFSGIDSPYKDVRVQYEICTTTDPVTNKTRLHDLKYCEDRHIDTNTSTYSTDNFAIRPYAFAAFGKNQYKRAGEDFNVTIKAVNEANASKLGNSDNDGENKDNVDSLVGYNAVLSDLNVVAQYFTPTDADIQTMKDQTGRDEADLITCSNSGTFAITNNTDSFNDGVVDASLNFTETGILDINISEASGKEWALVDSDDTPDDQRYIKNSSITYDDSNITANIIMLFVPYKFDTKVTYDNTAADEDWLYINDINPVNKTPKHAAYITYTIVAKNKSGDTTKNYTSTCFPDVNWQCPRVNGLKLNTTFDLFLDAHIVSTKEANISLHIDNNSSQYIYTHVKKLAIHEGNNSIQETFSPYQFTDGVGVAKVYFNIDRNISVPVNPIVITLKDANTSTSWMTQSNSPKEFNGTVLDSNKTFYYGRAHAKRQRFTGTTGDSFINYEVYCNGTGCDKALLQDGLKSAISDDPRWFINSHHVTAKDGAVIDVTQKGANLVTSTEDSAAPTKASLTYSGSSFPYKVTMEATLPEWLLYNKYNSLATTNEFEVEFTNSDSSWAGKRETNTTTNTTAAEKTNRRSMW
jgi:hypothetical protein